MTQAETTAAHQEVRPFRVDVPEEDLADLRRRILATRWPSKELVEDRSQGVQLEALQEFARYPACWQPNFGRPSSCTRNVEGCTMRRYPLRKLIRSQST